MGILQSIIIRNVKNPGVWEGKIGGMACRYGCLLYTSSQQLRGGKYPPHPPGRIVPKKFQGEAEQGVDGQIDQQKDLSLPAPPGQAVQQKKEKQEMCIRDRVLGLLGNLVLLGYFKYANFFLDNLNWLLGRCV